MLALLAQRPLKDMLFGNHPDAAAIVNNNRPTDLINSILPNVYGFASLILLVYMVFGGFMIISSAGSPDKAKKGQEAITNAIIGFAIIFTSFWVIQAIQFLTGVPILNSGLNF